MSNLLPEKQLLANKRLFTLQYLQHLLVWVMFVGLFAVGTAVLLRMYVHHRYAIAASTIQKLTQEGVLPDETAIVRLEKNTDNLATILTKPTISSATSSLLSLRIAGVAIDTITTGAEGSLLITGSAKAMTLFTQLVGQIKKINTVTVLESHYSVSDGTFLINGTIN